MNPHLAIFDEDRANNVVWVPNPSQWRYITPILTKGHYSSLFSKTPTREQRFDLYITPYHLYATSLIGVVRLHF